MNQRIASSANSSAGASSLTTGTNSVLSGSSNIQHNMSMNTDSLTSSGAASMGLPTSPLSFSSSNGSMPGSSSLGGSSLVQPGVSTLTRLGSQQDLNTEQTKPLNSTPSQLAQAGHQALQPQQGQQTLEFGKHIPQPHEVQILGTNQQPMGHNAVGMSGSPHLMRAGHLHGVKQELQNSEQHLAQLQASMAVTKTMRDDVLHQHALQNILQRPDSVLSTQLQRHESLQRQQSQHVQAQLNYLQQQRFLQQQQMLQMLPQHLQRNRLLQQQHQLQQHLQQQIAGLTKQPTNESGICARRLMHYMHSQRMRPADNNIGFWRKFIAEYFAPHARKRWCLSQYGAGGRQPAGVFPQDLWRCEICGSNPGRGFEATVEVLPRLCKTKYDNGELEELLFVDVPHEYKLSSGLTVLEYGKAIQESVFEQLRVVWDGQLKIIFTPELKILSWDFCARSHEELLPRRTVVPQVSQLVAIASKYQNALAQNGGAGLSAQDLQANCNMFVSSARQLAKSLEPPSVNEIGFTKRYVRCIQIAEVVNSMKDLIDFSRENNMGPIDSLSKFPRRTATSVGMQSQCLQPQSDQPGHSSFVAEQNAAKLNPMQMNIDKQMNNSLNRPLNGHVNTLGSFQSLLRQNSNSSQSVIQNDPSFMRTLSGGGSLSNSLQASPTSSLTSFQTSLSSLSANPQPPLSTFSNSLQQNSGNNMLQQSPLQPVQGSQQNPDSVVQHLLQEMNPQLNSGGTFPQGSPGNTGFGNGMGNGLVSFPGQGTLGMNNGNIRSSIGGLGSGSGSLGGNMGGGNGLNIDNCLRNMGNNVSQMGSIGAANALGNRLNFAALAQQQNLHLLDGSMQQDHISNGSLNGLGASTDLGNLPYSWKS